MISVDQSHTLVVKQSSVKKQRSHPYRSRDPWLILVLIIASIASISTTVYYFGKHEILLYNDAYAHLRIARGIIDSLTPGFYQLSDTWLPLQHISMLPFIWNYYLWQTGIAGAIPTMICYVISAGYLFCILRRLTKQVVTSLIGVTIFLCNPNILYLQSTPLTEVMCAAAFAATAYYFLCWLQKDNFQYLLCTAVAVCVATLIRYDGWALFLVVGTLVIIAGVFKKHDEFRTSDHIMAYLSISPLGIISWLLWNKIISSDPFYFQHGLYSAQVQQLSFLRQGKLPTYHNILISFRFYVIDAGQTIGWGLFVCALLGLVLTLMLRRRQQEYFVLAVILTPFIFYVASLYLGQSIIFLPGAGSSTFFNVRYGSQIVLPAAFLIAMGISPLYSIVRRWYVKVIFMLTCFALIGMEVIGVNASGVISLQDGLSGRSCINATTTVILSLAQHYNGGRILADEYTSDINLQLFGADFKDIIYEASGPYLQKALVHPEKYVDWVAINPYNTDDVVEKLFKDNKKNFLSHFRFISSDSDGLQLYYRIGAPLLQTRPIPNNLINIPHTCKSNV